MTDPDLKIYLDDKFRGVHARLDRVEERGEKTQDLASATKAALDVIQVRAEERGKAAEEAVLRADSTCASRTATVAGRVQDLENDRKKIIGGILAAIAAGVISLFRINFNRD